MAKNLGVNNAASALRIYLHISTTWFRSGTLDFDDYYMTAENVANGKDLCRLE